MKAIFGLLALAAVPAVLAANPHDVGFSRRHHHLERAPEPVSLPHETGLAEYHEPNNSTHEFERRAFTNARSSYYKVGLGACGRRNVPSDFIVALNAPQFGSGYPGKHCFEKIRITYKGISAIAEIRDRCPGCGFGGLDFSEGLFAHFSPLSAGIIYTQWEFLSGGGGGGDDQPTTTKSSSTHKPTTTTTTTTRRSTTRHTSSTPSSSSSSSHHTSDDDDEPTSTGSESPTSTPTPTPTLSNNDALLQAVLQMGELLGAGSRVSHSEE